MLPGVLEKVLKILPLYIWITKAPPMGGILHQVGQHMKIWPSLMLHSQKPRIARNDKFYILG